MTSNLPITARKQSILSPNERISEVLFGLIMVLTVTGSIRVIAHDREEVRAVLAGALGCNLAWGIIDGVMYLMGRISEKNTNRKALQSLREATDLQKAHEMISKSLPPLIASLLQRAELEAIRRRLMQLSEPSRWIRLAPRDYFGALGAFLLVFLSTFPVTLPFIFMKNAAAAINVSNAIAIAMLFVAGFAYGKDVGRSPWLFGMAMVGLGVALVALTKALGG